jgi:hypothetical protein
MGISEIVLADDSTLLVLERDKGQGIGAEIKRVYQVSLSDAEEDAELSKTLVRDLLEDFGYVQEKAEGMTLLDGDIWVVNDNDGAGRTRLINIGSL